MNNKQYEYSIRINKAKKELSNKLKSIGLKAPLMDEYYRDRYYKNQLNSIDGILNKYADILMSCLISVDKPIEEISIIDYGGGLGIFALLSKAVGVGNVIYNDIDEKFLSACSGIDDAVSGKIDSFILGDIDILTEKINNERNKIDIIYSFDVVEHIYDLDLFFDRLLKSKYRPRVIHMSSNANMFNIIYLWKLFPIQREKEKENSAIRRKIIEEAIENSKCADIEKIARVTRGLIRKEILDVVTIYLETGKINIKKNWGISRYDPYNTNTVNPENGWWAEHLFNPYYLRSYINRYNYKTKVLCGRYYGRRGKSLNGIIELLKAPLALPIAPHYSIYAVEE